MKHWKYAVYLARHKWFVFVAGLRMKHFTREMVADWMGAGRAITGKWDAPNWYAKNREKIQMHDSTRERVEELLAGRGKEQVRA